MSSACLLPTQAPSSSSSSSVVTGAGMVAAPKRKNKKISSQQRTGFELPMARIRKRVIASGLSTSWTTMAQLYLIAGIETVLTIWFDAANVIMSDRKKKLLTKRILDMTRLVHSELREIFPQNSFLVSVATRTRPHLSLNSGKSRAKNLIQALQQMETAAVAGTAAVAATAGTAPTVPAVPGGTDPAPAPVDTTNSKKRRKRSSR